MANRGIIWIKLSENSKNDLVWFVGQEFPVLYADHVTLAFKVFESDYADMVGKRVDFVATEADKNGDIQAVRVRLPDWIKGENRIPHITVSAREGVPPNNSNQMYQTGQFEARSLVDGLELTGVVEFFEFNNRA